MWFCALSLLLVASGIDTAQCKDSSVNCTGECGQFIDENEDGYCDESIIDSSLFITEYSTIISDKETIDTSILRTKEEKKIEKKSPIIEETTYRYQTKPGAVAFNFSPPKVVANEVRQHGKDKKSNYHFLSIVIPLMIGYFLMQWLSDRKKIKKATFLRIWNILLLITFLVTAFLGLLITAKIIYHLQLPYMKIIYILHVDFGVAMAIISVFHLLRHWNYYKTILGKK
jgi:hypothetical protein